MTAPVPRLYHAAPSYYSMIARLALIEAGVPFEPVRLDIHRRKQQLDPDYVRINPDMTVPALAWPGRILADSRLILAEAFASLPASAESEAWVDKHYAFPIEELTMGRLMATNPLARRFFPRTLVSIHARLLTLAEAHPDLAERYRHRAERFAERIETFDPSAVVGLFAHRLAEAESLLDQLDAALADGRSFLDGQAYGPADVVWTVFLARMRFVGRAEAVTRRPSLARYEAAMSARPSHHAADLWTKLHPLRMLRQLFG
ncbi:glutathione S-transferase family protein [Phreatobacter aquaticus]|nr:glutathione S-transferase family protein [Phreatobacter aquaticus]